MTEFEYKLIKENYETEIDEMHKIDARAPLYVLVAAAVGGLVSYSWLNLAEIPDGTQRAIAGVFNLIATGTLIAGIVNLFRSYVGRPYRYQSDCSKLLAYFDQLRRFHEQAVPGDEPDREAKIDALGDAEIRRMIGRSVGENADFNRAGNRERHRLYNICMYCFIAGLVLELIPGLLIVGHRVGRNVPARVARETEPAPGITIEQGEFHGRGKTHQRAFRFQERNQTRCGYQTGAA